MNALPEHSVTSLDVIHHMDALMLMDALPDASIDAIITDMPYGTTACSWDTIVPFADWWPRVKRVLKPRGVFVTTASQPFTSALVMSNPAWFREELTWDKRLSTGFLDANRKHLKQHENVIVFSDGLPTYNPTMRRGVFREKGGTKRHTVVYGSFKDQSNRNDTYYPTTILAISNADQTNKQHPTQKPVALYEYLIRTYTQPGDVVLDPFCGSGTTAIAARNTKRHYILGDFTREYVDIARLRINGTGVDMLNAKDPAPLDELPLFAQAVNA